MYQKQKEDKEKCEPGADGAKDLVANDVEEHKVLNAFFASGFHDTCKIPILLLRFLAHFFLLFSQK